MIVKARYKMPNFKHRHPCPYTTGLRPAKVVLALGVRSFYPLP